MALRPCDRACYNPGRMPEGARDTAVRPTHAEIRLDRLTHNLHAIRSLVGPDVAIMAVVKANGYGHGGISCAQVFAKEGVAWLGVALPEEGVALRNAGIDTPILCLGGFWDGQESTLLDFALTPAISRIDQLDSLDREAGRRGVTAPVHLKFDTGLGRLGLESTSAGDTFAHLARRRNLEVDGLMTHLASADVPGLEGFTRGQIERFHGISELARAHGVSPRWTHLANGAGLHAFPEARGNLVRPGAVLYGLKRDILSPAGPELDVRPAMRFVSSIEHIKTVPAGTPLGYGCTYTTTRASRVATIPAGYADGVRRALSNRGIVGLRGTVVPIVGRISMDLTIADVTDVPDAALGDEVVLFGDGGPTVEDVAAAAGSISYEITCGVSARVPRIPVPGAR